MRIFSKIPRLHFEIGPISPPHEFHFDSVHLNSRGEIINKTKYISIEIEELLPGNIRLELVKVPAGMFQMGSHHEGGYEDEHPVHPVFLQEFWLGKYPITQAQWRAVMKRMPICRFHGDDLPIETISWIDAHDYCIRLSRLTGRKYGLPSESQWEYACRAGTSTPFSFGETITTRFANYVGNHTFRDEPPGIYRHSPTPGGTFPPNPWGLCDMHGNLWEFCADAWSENYNGAPFDGSPNSTGHITDENSAQFYCARGGSWHEPPAHCRSAMRLKVEKNDHMEYYGLRVALFV